MVKARNGIRYGAEKRKLAVQMRLDGRTHREIAKVLKISTGTAFLSVKRIRISHEQKLAIEERRHVHHWSNEDCKKIGMRLRQFQFQEKYSLKDLLDKIKLFHEKYGRIPLKHELDTTGTYRRKFGSWNNAVSKAGFEPNAELFAKKCVSRDGHICDSFSEKIIDEWLVRNRIPHLRSVRYGKTKFTADFLLPNNVLVEYFGLAKVKASYDVNIKTKRKLAKQLGFKLIELYPEDLYQKNALKRILRPHFPAISNYQNTANDDHQS